MAIFYLLITLYTGDGQIVEEVVTTTTTADACLALSNQLMMNGHLARCEMEVLNDLGAQQMAFF